MTPFRTLGLLCAGLLAMAAGARGADEDRKPSPDEAWKQLKDGNSRFLKDESTIKPLSPKEWEKQARSQRPIAVVLTCADSRVSPELIFDQGLGRLFVLRVAGNVTEPGGIGSIEYAVQHLNTPLIVVLGHENCGAVKAALEDTELHGNLGALIDQVHVGRALPADPKAALRTAIKANVLHHAGELPWRSVILRDYAVSGRLRIVAGIYSLESGEVTWLELPKMSQRKER